MSELDELVQTPAEADTVVDEGSQAPAETSEEQDTPKRWAGKYESPEELERAYIEAQRKIGEQGERLGRQNILLEADNPFMPESVPVMPGYPMAANPGVPATPQRTAPMPDDLAVTDEEWFGNKDAAISKIEQRAVARVRAEMAQAAQLNQLEQQFYSANKDINPTLDKPLVDYYASKLAQTPPHVRQSKYPDPIKAVAEAVREHKRRYTDEAQARKTTPPLHVGPGGGAAPVAAIKTESPRPKTEEEFFRQGFAELQKSYRR